LPVFLIPSFTFNTNLLYHPTLLETVVYGAVSQVRNETLLFHLSVSFHTDNFAHCRYNFLYNMRTF
jgi:hypothetical protein